MQELVIGGNLRALLYSYKTGTPVLFVTPKPPFRFHYLPGEVTSRIKQRQAWEALLFILNLSGLVLFPGILVGLRVEDNRIVAKAKRDKVEIKFDKLIIFDDTDIDGLPRVVSELKCKNRVIDWINIRSSSRHEIKSLYGDDNFVSEIIFYSSDRSDNKKHKDLVSISYLADEELLDFNYSSTMVKFKVLDMMKRSGIKGKRNGIDPRNKNKYKYYAIKIEPTKRKIENLSKRIYEEDDRFIFIEDPLSDILNMEEVEHPIDLWELVCRQTSI
jgi:hypothetical protein